MKFNQRIVLEAITDSGGIKKDICARLGIARPTLDEWIAKHPTIKSAYAEEKEKLKDLCDQKLVEQISMGNLGAIIWYQKTQCRDRGYIEKREIDVRNFDDNTLLRLLEASEGGGTTGIDTATTPDFTAADSTDTEVA